MTKSDIIKAVAAENGIPLVDIKMKNSISPEDISNLAQEGIILRDHGALGYSAGTDMLKIRRDSTVLSFKGKL